MKDIKDKKLKARELASIIRNDIVCGRLHDGDRIEPVRTLAKSFNVGRGIAYAAIEILKDEGLLTAKGRSGVYVNKNEDALYSAKRPRIGFYIHTRQPITEDEYSMLHALSAYGLITGCDLILGYPNVSVKLAKWALSLDALLVTGYVDDVLISELKTIGLPFIVIGNYEWKEKCNNMRFDVRRSIREMIIEVYSRLKFETLGMVLCSPELYAVREAIDAARDVQKTFPFGLSDDDILFDPTEDGYKSMKMIMMRPQNKRPQAIILSYQSVFGAARYVYESNLKSFERPVLISKMQENLARLMPGFPDVIIFDDAYSSFSHEVIDWLMTMIGKPQLSEYETRVHFSQQRIIFN
ncbi:MAG: hypothetical protein A2X49_11350 [Lentisphaerae bacterium GWF2_52_8]|nr:MAG: hypothetical protein A2X49_11350 [Lentisphaerae bacterium GWF2_52_8]